MSDSGTHRVARRWFGRTGIDVPEIAFGCGTTADLMIHGAPEVRRHAVRRALELGIDYFDTAPLYGDCASEANLGRALRELGATPVIATKVALQTADLGDRRGDISAAVVRSGEASIARLAVPSVALMQLHNRVGTARAAKAPLGSGALLTLDDVLGPGGVVEGLRILRDRGLVRHFGCCAYGGDMDCVNELIASGAFDAIILNYSVLNPTAWTASPLASATPDYAGVGARAAAAGMAAIALRVLEGGELTAAPRERAHQGERERLIAKAARDLQPVWARHGLSPQAGATRFALSNPQVATVVVGFSSIAQIEEAAACSKRGPLSAELLRTLGTA